MNALCNCGCSQPVPLARITDRRRGHIAGQPIRFINGHNARTHGKSQTPEFKAWAAAYDRCTNPNNVRWEDYGGRGIKFLFTSFEQFFAEVGPRPEGTSLDRINNDGNYEPGNVRWATPAEQQANRRYCKKEAL